MADDQEFAPEVVEAVARKRFAREWSSPWEAAGQHQRQSYMATAAESLADVCDTLRGLGVLAGPGEVVVPVGVIGLFESALAKAREADPEDAPFPMNRAQASAYHQTRADLLTWVLEMMNVPEPLAAAPRAGTEGGE